MAHLKSFRLTLDAFYASVLIVNLHLNVRRISATYVHRFVRWVSVLMDGGIVQALNRDSGVIVHLEPDSVGMSIKPDSREAHEEGQNDECHRPHGLVVPNGKVTWEELMDIWIEILCNK
jgi:hypothetical protein